MTLIKLLTILTILSSSVYASGTHKMMAKKGNGWEKRRDKKLAKITNRISKMTKNKDCLSAAKSKDAFKSCMKTTKDEMKNHKGKMMKMKH